MRRFHASDVRPGPYTLGEDEARHLVQVLRAKTGDGVEIADGRGAIFPAEILAVDRRHAQLQVGEPECHPEPTPRLTLLVAPTKHTDRFEWFLEKACECGVSAIQPIWTARSERRVEKHERWNRTLVEAMKQSRRAWLPVLHHALPLGDALDALEETAWRGVAHCPVPEHPEWTRTTFTQALPSGRDAVMAIGPEGDFTPEELEHFARLGFTPVTFGDHRLRTETAALHAVQAFHIINALK